MADADTGRVVVSISGRTYTFATSQEQPAEYIRQAAQLVDDYLRQAQQETPAHFLLQAALLTGLNLTNELYRLQEEYQVAESDISRRTSTLATSIGRLFQDLGILSEASSKG